MASTIALTIALTFTTPTAPPIDPPPNIAAWEAAHARYPRWIPAPPTSTPPEAYQDPVGRWEPLVAAHFHPDHVQRALRVIDCESEGDPTADNPRSTAAGLFQFIRSTWDWQAAELGLPTYDQGGPLNPEHAIRAAAHLSRQGADWSHWVCKP